MVVVVVEIVRDVLMIKGVEIVSKKCFEGLVTERVGRMKMIKRWVWVGGLGFGTWVFWGLLFLGGIKGWGKVVIMSTEIGLGIFGG